MKNKIVSAVLLSGLALNTAAPAIAHADDFDTKIEAQDVIINNIASEQETAQAQVASLQEQVASLQAQRDELTAVNAQLEEESKQLAAEIESLSQKIVARSEKLKKQARSAQKNKKATSYLNTVLESDTVSEAFSRLMAIRKVVLSNDKLLKQQKADRAALEEKQKANQEAINTVIANQALLTENSYALATQQAELELAQVNLAAALATAQDEKATLLTAKAEAEAAATAAAEAQAKAEQEQTAQAAAQILSVVTAQAALAEGRVLPVDEAASQVVDATIAEETLATVEATPAVTEGAAAAEVAPVVAEEPVAVEETPVVTEEPVAVEPTPVAVEEPAAAEPAPVAVEEPAVVEEPVVAEPAPAVVEEPVVAEPAPAPVTSGGINHSGSGNFYPVGQCTWGVKELAPWVGTYWGNGAQWAASAAADGYTIGTTPVVGAIAVWNDGGYGHVALVTGVQSNNSIQVMEANVNGNQYIANHRGWFDPTTAQGYVSYIYP